MAEQARPAAPSGDQQDPPAAGSGRELPPGVHARGVRSFVMRAGRTTSGQQKALENLGPQFILPFQSAPLDWEAAFGRVGAPRIAEIGFGMGETTAHIAALLPQKDFLGMEVHEPGVGALLKRIGEQELPNLRILRHDAVEVMRQMIASDSLDGVHVFFPDPWHKKRHHKRRLIQPEFVSLLASRLKPGGYLHCATDWQPYAEQMLEVLSGEPQLRNTAPDYAPRRDYRPVTKFEKRGLRLGHGVWDLVFTRCASAS
ncbi:MAG: tRNA (guanosine(46)-N7)-methyltransferase TrmB [Candidatus Protistobacter heckmanni]|nr:tRNA (guanosine(46)-N7)-methyltransferase TrmB [Candidatus Protistobacter heckmanni]